VSIADFTAPDYGAQVSVTPADQAAPFTEAARLAEQGRLSIPVQQTYTLDHAAEGHVTGRLIVTLS
jgi:hypothetical protein